MIFTIKPCHPASPSYSLQRPVFGLLENVEQRVKRKLTGTQTKECAEYESTCEYLILIGNHRRVCADDEDDNDVDGDASGAVVKVLVALLLAEAAATLVVVTVNIGTTYLLERITANPPANPGQTVINLIPDAGDTLLPKCKTVVNQVTCQTGAEAESARTKKN
jgi:hypothetical protein